MIAHLKGTIIAKQPRALVVDVHGVGYLVHTSRTLLESKSSGENVSLFIHMHVREDDLSLYGFSTSQELDFFKLLLSVSGIGPRSALELMNLPLIHLKQAIVKKDLAYLTHVPGIGRKTAERICVDLSSKIELEGIEEISTESGAPMSGDIIDALVSLGFTRQHVVVGLKKVPASLTGAEEIIKYFLQNR